MKKKKNYSFEARNSLLIKLYVLSVALAGIILHAGGIPFLTNLIGILFGVTTIIIATLMHKFHKKINWIPYFLIVSLAMMTVFMLLNRPAITTYLLVYYSVIIISLYHNYRYVIVSGFFGVIITNYFAINYGEETIVGYDSVYLASLNLLFILMTTFLIYQSIIGKSIQNDTEVIASEAMKAKENMGEIVDHVRSTVNKLEEINVELTNHSSSTNAYANELALTFKEISSGVESQSNSAMEMSESIYSINEEVDNISSSANTMKDRALNTSEMVKSGSVKVEQLNKTISELDHTLQTTVEEMKELNSSTAKVGDILQTISDIADQTNLLALNAAIEASRAGESGKGFAVVAQEVRKLAEHSIQSTNEIGNILTLIQDKANSATTRVTQSENTFKTSKDLTNETGSAFNSIEQFVMELQEISTEINQKVELLSSSSATVVDEVNSVSSVSEELNASAEEVLASVEEQNAKITGLNEKVKDMDRLTKELNAAVTTA
ncbi:methyl-accepting chemotaxis protein [Natronobacillus azotifigens]|uniref:Methyl-accepting chemotaxis protein n=1 Tax=Natronobacillus azotifigens TaxID=472978 RepID=A0A9J6RC22_9BACI|nr:methyl-accepting chemotaxis protein [Natronobacillus azotifigens]